MGTKLRDDAANNPTDVGRCTECAKIYTVIESTDGNPLPSGTDGTCTCGNDEFTIVGA